MKITEKESLWLQAMATTSLIAELSNQDFLNSSYFEKLRIDKNIRKVIKNSGLGSPAMMLMFLYISLVPTAELIKNSEAELNDFLRGASKIKASSGENINYIEIITEAVKSAEDSSYEFIQEGGTTAIDFKYKGDEIIVRSSAVGELITKVNVAIVNYPRLKSRACIKNNATH